MPSPSDSSSVASASGSRGWSDSRRGMSARGQGGARLLLYLGLCHLGLGAMVLAFSFTSMAFTSSARVRQSCPFWAGFFVVASGVVGIISWRRPLTLVNAQMVKSMLTCQVENGLCVCCAPTHSCSITEEETLVLYLNADCHSVRLQLKDLLFSACGLSILSTIICTLSTVTCSIHIFSLDLVHLLAPHRTRSVNPECTTPQDAFLTNIMDFEEFVPPIPPPPYYPPEYTCSSETDAQSITYNGSMESPVPLYPTDCPPPYEAVMGQRAASQATVFDTPGTELSGERVTSTAFSGEVSLDSGSLLMSEIVDIPDDSSPSEDSCLMEIGVRNHGRRSYSTGGEGGRGVGEAGEYVSFRGPLTLTPESPLAILASSCSQLEVLAAISSKQCSSIAEIRVAPGSQFSQGSASVSSALPSKSSLGTGERRVPGGLALPRGPLFLRRRGGKGEPVDLEGSKEGSQMSTDIGALPSKGSIKEAAAGFLMPAKPPTSPLRLPKDCHRSLGDLKVTRVLVARFLQRSKRNLAPSSDHTGSQGSQGPKRRVEGPPSTHLPLEQVIRSSFGASRGHSNPGGHRRGHSHSHSDGRHSRRERAAASQGIHLRSCGDLSSSSSSLRRLVTPHAPHGSSGALYSESAL
ncbi:hypothetical protein NHX12_000839 [Muraenolepis orangiensis]|uniref:Uncharacterized protein n=1 Tax=Muraenolepis orangiensis TaxID=630683 RepID=A0A9Q0IHL6_9TELE|nr:hypothetical protein NHX12_000839 [Muraenolepis orangiensis]